MKDIDKKIKEIRQVIDAIIKDMVDKDDRINKKPNKLTFGDDDEWYTCEIDIDNFVKQNNNVDFSKIIVWLPFDNENSAFVKYWKKKGWRYICSHIECGKDFYKYEPKKYDLIISNPPFKGKKNIIERMIELDKPFAFLFGIQCFNSGGFIAELSKVKDLKMIFLQQRIKFHKGDENAKLTSPTFHSMWIMSGSIWKDKISFMLKEGVNNESIKEIIKSRVW